MTFTPGSDEGRTDTYEAQKKLQEDDQTAEEQFDEAQQGLRDANTFFQRFLGIMGALQQSGEDIVESIVESIGKDNTIVTPEQPIIEDVPQYPVVIQRILKIKKDNPEAFSGIVGSIGEDNTEEEKDEPLDVEAELKAYYEKLDRELAPPKQEDIVVSGAKVRTRRIMDRDLKDLLLKYPNIDPNRARRYVDLNARGIADIKKTIEYLNDVSLKNTPNPDDLEDVAAEFSVIFGVDAQVEDLQKIIEERGEIMFKTQSMDQPFVIRDLSDLKAAYFQRLNVLKKANVFDEGHVFAVNSLLRDKNVIDLATYKNNIEPEIARSIEQLIDKQTLEELIAPGQGPAYLEKVVLGNRSRKDENDPDKAVARVFGGAYGVEEDFLNFMFPERTVAERVPPELKDTFVDLYNKELAALLQNFPKSKPGQGGLQIGSFTLERLKEQIQNLVAEEMNLATGLNTALNEQEYARIKKENPEILLYLDERFGGKEEYVTPDKPARRIRRKGMDTKGLDEFRVGSSWDIGE
tara:strand:+ start:220 stop:1779 length:1560 start_codon:yes stop_codon:yes gene_type:complete